MYVKGLATLGVHKTMNKTRLKNSLLEHLPGAQEQFSGKQIVIIFKKAIEGFLRCSSTEGPFGRCCHSSKGFGNRAQRDL